MAEDPPAATIAKAKNELLMRPTAIPPWQASAHVPEWQCREVNPARSEVYRSSFDECVEIVKKALG
jgi:hypothetical protein